MEPFLPFLLSLVILELRMVLGEDGNSLSLQALSCNCHINGRQTVLPEVINIVVQIDLCVLAAFPEGSVTV